MAQLRNSNLAGVKLTPSERKQIIARYAKYATRPDGSVDAGLALQKYGQRQYRATHGLALGKGDSSAARRARAVNALGTPDTDSLGVAYAAGQTASQSPPTTGPKVTMTGTAVAGPKKGGTAGGRPAVSQDDPKAARRNALISMFVARRGSPSVQAALASRQTAFSKVR